LPAFAFIRFAAAIFFASRISGLARSRRLRHFRRLRRHYCFQPLIVRDFAISFNGRRLFQYRFDGNDIFKNTKSISRYTQYTPSFHYFLYFQTIMRIEIVAFNEIALNRFLFTVFITLLILLILILIITLSLNMSQADSQRRHASFRFRAFPSSSLRHAASRYC